MSLQQALEDPSWFVRIGALVALDSVEPSALVEHAETFSRHLDHDDACVRVAALEVLGRLSPNEVALRGNAIADRLGDERSFVRLAALEALGRLEPSDLSVHALPIAQCMEDRRKCVRRTALVVLSQLEPIALADFAEAIVECLGDAKKCVRGAALAALENLELGTLARHLHWRDSYHNMPLHIAAQEGNLKVSEQLVQAGALVRAKNSQGLRPADLAQMGGHKRILTFLEGCNNFATIRGGIGDALAPALADDRLVARVEWYTIPCPGIVGRVGAVHSLLAISVDGSDAPPHTYVLEKAALVRGVSECEDQFRNGVHVSHWRDVAPNVETGSIHTLDFADIAHHTRAANLTVSTLRDIAVDLGPYDLVRCNCHHTALAVYNACAREFAQVPQIPNPVLTWGASLLRTVGMDVARVDHAIPALALQSVLSSFIGHDRLADKDDDDGDDTQNLASPKSDSSIGTPHFGKSKDPYFAAPGDAHLIQAAAPFDFPVESW